MWAQQNEEPAQVLNNSDFSKEKPTSTGRVGRGADLASGRCCVRSGVLWLHRFSFPGPTTVPLSRFSARFPWQVPCVCCPRGGFKGEHRTSRFGNASLYLAPIKPSNHTVSDLKGWRLCPFLTVQLLPVALPALKYRSLLHLNEVKIG